MYSKMLLLFSLILLTWKFSNCQNPEALTNSNHTVLEIENGRIMGARFNIIDSNNFYYGYRKIPFAAPPLGILRFKSPQPVKNWTNVLNTDQKPGLCIQQTNVGSIKFKGSEDCLYCSIYTPKLPSESGKLLSVMVYFFGGSFTSGNISKASFGPDYFMDENVILVLTNYRLGIFGLFSTENEFAPGNIAFKDQSFLLRWVNRNIQFFGGDKNRITIFGQSSGAVSVSLHLQSPMSKGLFSGAIMQSGSSLCSWSLSQHVREVSFRVGSLAGVNTSSSEVLVRKLQTLEASVIFQAYNKAFLEYVKTHDGRTGLPLGPIIEKDENEAFFTSYSHKLLSSGRYNAVPTIIGFNSLEGAPPLTEQPQKWLSINSMNYASYPPEDANISSNTTLIKIGKEIKDRYWGNNLLITVNSTNTNKFFSDDLFFRPIIETARLFYKKMNSTYLYKFTYQGELGLNTNQAGVLHGDDTNYYWERNRTASEIDKKVRKRQVRLWCNFAKYRKPTIQEKSDDVIGDIEWTTIGNSHIADDDIKYMEIGEQLKMKTNPSNNTNFWNEIYKKYGVPPFKTF